MHWDSIICISFEGVFPSIFSGKNSAQQSEPKPKLFRGLGHVSAPGPVLSKTCFLSSVKRALVLMPVRYFLLKSHFSSLQSISLTAFVLWSSDNIFTTLSYRPFSGRPDCIKNLSQRQTKEMINSNPTQPIWECFFHEITWLRAAVAQQIWLKRSRKAFSTLRTL